MITRIEKKTPFSRLVMSVIYFNSTQKYDLEYFELHFSRRKYISKRKAVRIFLLIWIILFALCQKRKKKDFLFSERLHHFKPFVSASALRIKHNGVFCDEIISPIKMQCLVHRKIKLISI